MAAIVVFIGFIDQVGAAIGQYRINGTAEVQGASGPIPWEVFVNFTDPGAVVNLKCMSSAIAAVQASGFVVTPADRKTLFAGEIRG